MYTFEHFGFGAFSFITNILLSLHSFSSSLFVFYLRYVFFHLFTFSMHILHSNVYWICIKFIDVRYWFSWPLNPSVVNGTESLFLALSPMSPVCSARMHVNHFSYTHNKVPRMNGGKKMHTEKRNWFVRQEFSSHHITNCLKWITRIHFIQRT